MNNKNLFWKFTTLVLIMFCVGLVILNEIEPNKQIDLTEYNLGIIDSQTLINFAEIYNNEPFTLCSLETYECKDVNIEVID